MIVSKIILGLVLIPFTLLGLVFIYIGVKIWLMMYNDEPSRPDKIKHLIQFAKGLRK